MTYTIAFVGNPNVGKSAWINALAKADFKVGNWAGVTVEKKEAHVVWGNETYHLIDLPGTHSLEEGVNEEGITGSYLRQNKVDLLVNVLDATNLAANLYLTLCLRELQIPMLVLFSFIDEVENMNMHIDTLAISRLHWIAWRLVYCINKIISVYVKLFVKWCKNRLYMNLCYKVKQRSAMFQCLIIYKQFYHSFLLRLCIESYVDIWKTIDWPISSWKAFR